MNSGRMVERRDQVLIGFFSLPSTAASTFLIRCASTNGPFLIERDMLFAPYLRLRRWTIMLLVRLLRRVFKTLAGVPHGLAGYRPPPVRPPPPPRGVYGEIGRTSCREKVCQHVFI